MHKTRFRRQIDPRVFDEIKATGKFLPAPDSVCDEYNRAEPKRSANTDFILTWILAESDAPIDKEPFRARAGEALRAWDAKFFREVAKILADLERHKNDNRPSPFYRFVRLAFRQEYMRCADEMAFVDKGGVMKAAVELWLDFYVNRLPESFTPEQRNRARNEEEKRILGCINRTRVLNKAGLKNLREAGE